MANIDDKKIPVGGKETPIPNRLHDVSEDHVVTGANEVFDDDFQKRQSKLNKEYRSGIDINSLKIIAEKNDRRYYDEQLREELNAKQLELGAVETDQEPTLNSPNHLTSGIIARSHGYFIESDEFVCVFTDAADRILCGIKEDSDIVFGVGIPSSIRKFVEDNYRELYDAITEILDTKVDKEEGKSLIEEDVADSIYYTSNSEWDSVLIDNEEHIILGIKKDGSFYWAKGVPKVIQDFIGQYFKDKDALNSFTYIDNPEWAFVIVDGKERIIAGLRNNGKAYVHSVDFMEYIEKMSTLINVSNNGEWLELHLDRDNHILFGVKNDGTFYWAKGVPKVIQEFVESKIDEVRRDIDNLDEVILDIVNTYLQPIQQELEELISQGIDLNSASGYLEEENALRFRINKIRGWNKAVFIIATDSHYGGYGIQETVMDKHAKVCAKLSDFCGVDFIAHLGDMNHDTYNVIGSHANYNPDEDNRRLGNYVKNAIIGKAPFVYSIAHHEMYNPNMWGGDIINIKKRVWGTAGTHISYLGYHYAPGSDTYYYFDIPKSKLRIVNLDTVDGGLLNLGKNQLVWIRDTVLANVPNGYGVIFLSHLGISDSLEGGRYGFSTFSENDHAVEGLTLDGIIQASNANVLALICGHTHYDNEYIFPDRNYASIAVGCDIPNKEPITSLVKYGNPESFNRVVGEYSEYCYDFVIPDVDNRVIYMERFGCGHNRVIFLDSVTLSTGGTYNLGTKFPEGTIADLSLRSPQGVVSINGATITAVSSGYVQIVGTNQSENTEYFIHIKVN